MAASPSPQVGLPAAEPKDGDFVAYLAAIERAQLARLPAAAPTPAAAPAGTGFDTPALTPAQADAVLARLRANAQRAWTPWTLALAVFGVLLLLAGLFGRGGFITAIIGAFVLWRALADRHGAARSRAAGPTGTPRATSGRKQR